MGMLEVSSLRSNTYKLNNNSMFQGNLHPCFFSFLCISSCYFYHVLIPLLPPFIFYVHVLSEPCFYYGLYNLFLFIIHQQFLLYLQQACIPSFIALDPYFQQHHYPLFGHSITHTALSFNHSFVVFSVI